MSVLHGETGAFVQREKGKDEGVYISQLIYPGYVEQLNDISP